MEFKISFTGVVGYLESKTTPPFPTRGAKQLSVVFFNECSSSRRSRVNSDVISNVVVSVLSNLVNKLVKDKKK